MSIRTAIWKISDTPQALKESSIEKEQQLEDMIVAAPRLLSDEWMVCGRQVDTGLGGRIDLLALAPDGSLVLIELKRGRTPRDVVAQCLDYAGWVEKLQASDIFSIYAKFAPGRDLGGEFQKQFGQLLDEETLNQNHQIIIVAEALDDSTERIVSYLSARNIPVNVLCFQVFANGKEQLLSRTWLLDPMSTPVVVGSGREPWNGEFYCSFGHGDTRNWEDAVQFGFISGGGAAWFSKTLRLLKPGDRIWARVPQMGFVGVGRVLGSYQPAESFAVQTAKGATPIFEVAKRGTYHLEFIDDKERCEYFVPVRWLETVPLAEAHYGDGLFGNQNTVCQPTTPKWRATVDKLKDVFKNYDKGGGGS